jgi:Concanavalin A-like lectin/glucanases superfamily
VTISVVQGKVFSGLSGSLNSAVTAGNTLLVLPYNYNSTNMSSSAPVYNGSTPSGSAKLTDVNAPSGGAGIVYTGIWMMPAVSGGGTSVGLTVTGSTVGMAAYEISGLGSAPQLDPGGGTSTGGNAGSATAASGSTPAITQSPELILGSVITYGGAPAGAGSPWTELSPTYSKCGYQVVTSSGGAYDYTMGSGGAGDTWAACIAAICAAVASVTLISAPVRPSRGVPLLRRGHAASQAPVPVPAAKFLAPSKPAKGAPAAKRGTAKAEPGAPRTVTGITEDPATPAVVQDVNGSGQPQVTTASFSPPAGSLLVAEVSLSYAGTPSLSVSDTGGHTWSEPVSVSPGASYGAAAVFTTYLTSAPGPITVTAKGGTGVTAGTIQLALRVVDGAAPVQAGAATATGDAKSASATTAITTTTAGSWVYIAGTVNELESSVTPNASTTTIANYQDTSGGDTLLAGRQTAATGTPGSTTLGWTTGTSWYWALAMLEILPATAPFTPPARPAKGTRAAVRGTGKGGSGVPYTAPSPVPSPFTSPQHPAKGRSPAARGRTESSPGAPRVYVPPPVISPFPLPGKPSRGTPAARRGSGKGRPGAPVPVAVFIPPKAPSRGRPAAFRGVARSEPGAPYTAPVPSPYTLPAKPSRGAGAASRGRNEASKGAPRTSQPVNAAPYALPRKPSKGASGTKHGAWKALAATASTTAPVVVNTWTAYRTATGSVGGTMPAPPTMPLDCPVANAAGHWLIAICSWAMPAAYLGATMAVADDVHGYWIPCGIPSGDSPASGLTRCSIWAKPNAAVTGNVYVAPCGLPAPVYPAAIGVTVIEVSGMSDYAGIPAVVTAASNAATSISASSGTPVADALMVTVAAGDGAPFTSGPGSGWTALTGLNVSVSGGGGSAILHTSPALQVSASSQSASWATGSASDLSACTAVILLSSPAPAQPSPTWPYTQLQVGFGSGALTPPSEITWTDITPRYLAGQESSAQRGKQRQLDQIQAGEISLTVENSDSAFDPGNTNSPYWPYVVVDTPIRLLMTWEGRTYAQWSGFVEKWPQQWKQGTRQGLASITVTDAWSLLIDGLNACQQQEIQSDSPYAYWTCGDAAGSAYAANSAAGNSNALMVIASKNGSLNAIEAFGADSGAIPGDPSATVWSQSGLGAGDAGYGYCLMCADPGYPALSSGITVMGWFFVDGTVQISQNLILFRGVNAGSGPVFQAAVSGSTGDLYVGTWNGSTRVFTSTTASTGNWMTAGWFHVALVLNQGNWSMYVNGAAVTAGTGSTSDSMSWLTFMGEADRFSTAQMINGECAHLAVFGHELTADRIASIFLAGCPTPLVTPGASTTPVDTTVAGAQFAGEYPANRIERLAAYGGWAGTRAISQTSTTAMGAITDIQGSGGYVSASGVVVPGLGQQAGEAITNIVGSDDGFMSVDGPGALCYVSRGDLYGKPPAWYVGELAGNPLNQNWSLVPGITPWTAGNGGTAAPSSAVTYLGYPAILLTGNGSASGPYAWSEATIPVIPETEYVASAWLYSPQGWTAVQMTINWFTATGGYISGVYPAAVPVTGGVVTPITAIGPTPANAAYAQFAVNMTGTPASTVQLYIVLPLFQPVATAGSGGEYPAQPGIQFSEDKALLYNVAELTQSTGTGAAVVASDPGSALQHGQSPYTATAYQELLAQVVDEANWVVGTQGTPVNRPESLTVNAGTDPVNWPLVLALEPATPIQAARRPVTASATTVVQAVAAQVTRKFDAQAGTASVSVTGDIFPEGQVLTADNPVLGQLSGSHPLGW